MTSAGVNRRFLKAAVVVGINLAVGALQFAIGGTYRGPFPGLVKGYLIDICLPFAAYFLLVLQEDSFRLLRAWPAKCFIVFAVISLAEIAQYHGKAVFGETYDPWDFAAYAAGALLAAITDRLFFPRLFPFWRTPLEMKRPGL